MSEEDGLVTEGELFALELNSVLNSRELAVNVADFAKVFDQIIVRFLAQDVIPKPKGLLEEASKSLQDRSVTIFEHKDDSRYESMYTRLSEIGHYMINHPDIYEEFEYIAILRD